MLCSSVGVLIFLYASQIGAINEIGFCPRYEARDVVLDP